MIELVMLTSRDLQQLDNLFDKKLNPIERKLERIEKNLVTITNFLDREVVSLKKKVSKMENHLGL